MTGLSETGILDALNLPGAAVFILIMLVNAALMRAAMFSIKAEVEKLEKKLEQLYTQLLKLSVLEARLGHLEGDLSRTQSRVEAIEQRFMFRHHLKDGI